MDIKCSDVAECSWVLNNWGCPAPVNRGGEHSFTWSSLGRWELSKFTLGRLVGFQRNHSPENVQTKKARPCTGLGSACTGQLSFTQRDLAHPRAGKVEQRCQHTNVSTAHPILPALNPPELLGELTRGWECFPAWD